MVRQSNKTRVRSVARSDGTVAECRNLLLLRRSSKSEGMEPEPWIATHLNESKLQLRNSQLQVEIREYTFKLLGREISNVVGTRIHMALQNVYLVDRGQERGRVACTRMWLNLKKHELAPGVGERNGRWP